MGNRGPLALESSVFLPPVLSLVGTGRRVERLIASRLGPTSPSATHLAGGEVFRAPRNAVYDVYEALAREIGDPQLGLKVAGRRQIVNLGEFAVTTAPTLGEALAVWARYYPIEGDNRIEVAEKDRRVVIRQHLGNHEARQFGDSLIAFQVPLIRNTYAGEAWAPIAVRLPYRRPADAATLEAILRCPIHYDASALEIDIARHDLALPHRRSDPALHELLIRLTAERVPPLPDRGIGEQVRDVLLEELPRGTASLVGVAARLNTSVRTLQRSLATEGTSYYAILEDTRRQLATHLLQDRKRRIIDVALDLGFDDPSSLYRALQRWALQAAVPSRNKRRSRSS
jgi:AraC-like DNA-binding protein